MAGSEVSPLCGALWQLVAAVNPCIVSQQSPGVAVKPSTHFYNEICMVWKLPEAAVNPLLMVWNLERVAAKPLAHFYI